MTVASAQVYTVTPTSKHNRPAIKAFPCHTLDYFVPSICIRNVRYFKKPKSSAFQTVVDALKAGLSEALEFYPVAGATVITTEKGELAIDAEHPSIRFHVESKDHPFEKENGDELAPRPLFIAPPAPVFATKITEFTCGTVIVASSSHHFAGDLQSYLDFLEAWATVVRNETPLDQSKLPKTFEHQPEHFFDNVKPNAPPTEIPRGFVVLPSPPQGPPPLPEAAVTIWQFPADIVEQLKRTCSPPKESGEWISTGDVMSGILFGAITRAREAMNYHRNPLLGRSSAESGTESLTMTADGRERSPNKCMTDGAYFGNFQVINAVTVPRATLTSTSLGNLATVALAIRTNLHQQVNPGSIKAKLGFFNNPDYAKPPGRILMSADVSMSSWCKFNLKGPQFSFGEMLGGKPYKTTHGGGVLQPGAGVLIKDYDTGTITMLLSVEAECREIIKKDVVLNEYAKLVDTY